MKTNRDYYSWSQHNLFKSSKLQFYKRYVLDEKSPELPQFTKGKEFGTYRETGEIPHWVDDPLLETVSAAIPRLMEPEKEVRVPFGPMTLLAYLDEAQTDNNHFYEFKTGKNPWNQKLVNNHKQLDFYATCIYLESGENVIPTCELIWIETEEYETAVGKELRYTGHVESFRREFTYEELENMAADILNTYEEILNWEFEQIDLDEDLVERYIELDEIFRNAKNEMDLIKLKIMDELQETGAKYAASSKGRFSLSQRKIPNYSAQLLIKEKQFKDEIDEMKRLEKESPGMSYSITESIRFNKIK